MPACTHARNAKQSKATTVDCNVYANVTDFRDEKADGQQYAKRNGCAVALVLCEPDAREDEKQNKLEVELEQREKKFKRPEDAQRRRIHGAERGKQAPAKFETRLVHQPQVTELEHQHHHQRRYTQGHGILRVALVLVEREYGVGRPRNRKK
jgi:hypothetical protein